MSELLKMLGCRYPIIQGPIAMFNRPKMVAAVSEAGGYGMLALALIDDLDKVKNLVDEVRDLTDKPFGANITLMNPQNGELLEVLAGAGVKTVTTSGGSPKNIYPIIHDLGMKGLHVVLTLHQAIRAETAGVDALVVAGSEAGGLRSLNSESSTMVLVPLVADHVKVPIVAAGGIADSRGYKAAFALGAEGVQVGTRFLASEESPAVEQWKKAIVECTDGGTDLRPINNMKVAERVITTPKIREGLTDPAAENIAAELDRDRAVYGAGQVSALIKDIKTIKEIIDEMVS